MATGKITKRTLDALQANAVEGFLWDEDLKGFGLRITAARAASYVVQYRMGGREAKSRRYTIGGHGSPWTPATARAELPDFCYLSHKATIRLSLTSSGGVRRSTSPSPTT